MPKVLVWQSCGLHRPSTQTDVVPLARQSGLFKGRSPTARNVLIKYSLQIRHLGWCCFFPLIVLVWLTWVGRRVEGGRLGVVGGGGGAADWLPVVLTDMLLSYFVVGWPRPQLIVTANVWILDAPPKDSQECAAEKTRELLINRTVMLQVNSLKSSRFIARPQLNFLALKKD